jgi:hypothetical protein
MFAQPGSFAGALVFPLPVAELITTALANGEHAKMMARKAGSHRICMKANCHPCALLSSRSRNDDPCAAAHGVSQSRPPTESNASIGHRAQVVQ